MAAFQIRRRAPALPAATLDRLLLDLLAQEAAPQSAYRLHAALHDGGHRLPAASVYRALDRLAGVARIEKVETLSAYRLRDTPAPFLMACSGCGRVTAVSAPDEHAALGRLMAAHGFLGTALVVEARGRCAACAIRD